MDESEDYVSAEQICLSNIFDWAMCCDKATSSYISP
jgi:hypothetical protein